MRVLLAEDDAMIGAVVRDRLRGQGFAVDWVRDGRAADMALADDAYDLLLLDLGLPGREGLAVLKGLRARGSTLPVVILTARDAVDDRVAGLDAGADDYVVKPYDPAHLEARIRAVLRRVSAGSDPVIEPPLRVGGLRVDRSRRTAEVDGRPVELTKLEFDLLAYLAEHPGRVVSRSELLREVWQRTDAARTVDVHLSWLRRKLGDTPAEPRFIHVNRGVGVMLEDRSDGAQPET